jgi:hypothetical protein
VWNWNFNDWVEFGKRQEQYMDAMHTSGKTEEQKKQYYENKNKPKTTPPEHFRGDSSGLIIYIAVMLGAIIFVDRWLIWIAATIIYFGRKLK